MAGKSLEIAEKTEVKSRAELREWLARNHSRDVGIWLIHHKKASPYYIPMDDIIDECLSFGWVDTQSRGLDEDRMMHWIAPRDPNSSWSAINKQKISRLEAEGLMTRSGRSVVEAAKENGAWSRLDAVDRLEIPPDLAEAFSRHPGAQANWERFTDSARRATLEWILMAKRHQTRTRRVAVTALEAAAGRPAAR